MTVERSFIIADLCQDASGEGGLVYWRRDTLDGLLRDVFETLLGEDQVITAGRGDFKEAFGASLHLTDPRARLSRSESKGKVYSALGEFLWYLSKEARLDFIDYYVPGRFQRESDDNETVRSGYGERLQNWRGINQLDNVVKLLKEHPTSRRAAIQLFDATDLTERFRSIPCTCTLQFLVRDGQLHMFVAMRSNDAYLGLPHDVFSFTMLQEMVARAVGVELGQYKHCAGSLHLYGEHYDLARQYLNEGWQDARPMPAMPVGDPNDGIVWLQGVEAAARVQPIDEIMRVITAATVDVYWKDLGLLLLSWRANKDNNFALMAQLKDQLKSDVHKTFLVAKLDAAEYKKTEMGVRYEQR